MQHHWDKPGLVLGICSKVTEWEYRMSWFLKHTVLYMAICRRLTDLSIKR